MRIVYDFEILRQLSVRILVPIFIVLIITSIAVLIYKIKHKNDEDKKFNAVLSSILMCIIISTMLFAISLAFSISFIGQMLHYKLSERYLPVHIFYIVLPLISLGFTVYFIHKFLKLYKKKIDDKVIKNEYSLEEIIDDKEINNEELMKYLEEKDKENPVEDVEENIDYDSIETLEEEEVELI